MTNYEKARAAHDKAFREFEPIRIAYTDVTIPMIERPSTATFIAAKRKYDEATAAFDAAFAEAQKA